MPKVSVGTVKFFFSVAHLIMTEAMYAVFRGLRKEASAGIDGVTPREISNSCIAVSAAQGGKYQAQPLRKIYVPKEDGKQRPISISALSILCFQYREDAEKVKRALAKRVRPLWADATPGEDAAGGIWATNPSKRKGAATETGNGRNSQGEPSASRDLLYSEVHRCNRFPMIPHEGQPALRGVLRSRRPSYPTGHGWFR